MKKFWSTLCIIVIASLVLAACGINSAPMAFINQSVKDWVLVTKDPYAQPTSTPFQPVEKTPMNTLEPTPAPTATPEAVDAVGGYVNPGSFVTPEGQINFLVLGSDYRPGGGFRTDVIMLIGINTKTNQVSAVSFPRDLCVYIPGTYTGYDAESCARINTAMQYGFETTAATFEANFYVRPDYYAMTNFQGFVALVDSLNGIDVNASQTLSDTCSLPQASGGYCTVNPGVTHMDGATALWYVRSRYSTSDYDRERRAQEVVHALFDRLLSLDVLTKIPAMFEIYKEYVETNIPLEVVLDLAKVAAAVKIDSIYRETLSPPEVIDTITSGGAMISLPNHYYIDPIIQKAFFAAE